MLVTLEEVFDEVVRKTTSSRTYHGKSNNLLDTGDIIKASPLCPKEGDPDPYDRSKVITDVQVRRLVRDSPDWYWEITTESSKPDAGQAPERSPLQDPAVITMSTEQYEEVTCYDRDGKPIMNTAGDLVYVSVPRSRWVFNVSKNVSSFPPILQDAANSLNDGMISLRGVSCRKETLQIQNISLSEDKRVVINEREIVFATLTFQLHYEPRGWVKKHPNVGFNEKVQIETEVVNDKGVPQKDSKGKYLTTTKTVKRRIEMGVPKTPTTEPVPLDRTGKAIENATSNDILEIKANTNKVLNFGNLPLR